VNTTPTLRVVVAGGGIAGLEALLALRELAGERIQTTLLSASGEFVYRPFTVAEPFGRGHANRIALDEVARDTGAELVRGALVRVDDAAGRAWTAEGAELGFDALLVAVGAVAVEGVPGATTWWPGGDAEILGGLLRDLEEGYGSSVAFVVPSGFTWPLPAYELALMAAREVGGMGQGGVEVSVLTPEPEPLAIFGADASAALSEELERAGVRLVTGASQVERSQVQAARVVAMPRLLGPAIEGLPADAEGFVLTGTDGRVEGLERTWAAGDGVVSPIKLGGLATWQAARAAAGIARLAGADLPEPADDEAVLEGVLMTGAEPRALGGAEGSAAAQAPIWRPSGKVSGRWLPAYVGDEPPTPAAPEGKGVPVRITAADVHAAEPHSLFDLSEPVHPNSPELRRLGTFMHDVRRRDD
jgi:sulfide:quinone oxidoreductase